MDTLTPTERQILRLLDQGLSNREIAAELHYTLYTIKWHLKQIYSKLQVGSRTQAVAAARKLGLLGDEPAVAPRHNLPAALTPFIGRNTEQTMLARLLADTTVRLITIIGPGGMGKTRLALAVANNHLSHFPGGVYLAALAPINTADMLIPTIAEAVGFRFYGAADPWQQLVDYLRDKRLLLVLDNLEHLLDGVGVVSDILTAAPDVKVLATSRQRLNLHGETVFPLDGLGYPADPQPAHSEQYDAVQLFIRSARRTRLSFIAEADDLRHIGHICQAVEGLPLALELAAAWSDVLTPEQIAAEIRSGYNLLENESGNLPERHRSIRAVFAHSWSLLTAEEQGVFGRLAVFRGGFTLDAAQAVAGASLRTMAALVSKSLMRCDETGRYDLHELLRQFAGEQLTTGGEGDVALAAHGTYYLDFVAQREADIEGRRQAEALHEIASDFENIRQAWLWAAANHSYHLIDRALDCLVNAAEMNGDLLDTYTLLQHTAQMLETVATEQTSLIRDKVILRLSRVGYLLNGYIDPTLPEKILRRVRQSADLGEIAYCLWTLADHARSKGDGASVLTFLEECCDVLRRFGNTFYLAHALTGMSGSYLPSQPARCLDVLHESIVLRRALGDAHGLSHSLWLSGLFMTATGSYAEAEHHIDEALPLHDESRHPFTFGVIASVKAELLLWRGETEQASHYAHSALDFIQTYSYQGYAGHALVVLTLIAVGDADYTKALSLCQQTQAQALVPAFLLRVNAGFALSHWGLGNYREARHHLVQFLRDHNHWAAANDIPASFLAAALLDSQAGNYQRSAELIGLASVYNPYITRQIERWPLFIELRQNLEAVLGSEAYTAAWERGRTLDVATVFGELLAEWANSP